MSHKLELKDLDRLIRDGGGSGGGVMQMNQKHKSWMEDHAKNYLGFQNQAKQNRNTDMMSIDETKKK